jgi:UDP-N-acetylglucosamine 1-carboxyvinyltransferase
MDRYVICGGERLSGQVKISGAKNAVLPILAGTLMTKNAVLKNVPNLSDVSYTVEILENLGMNITIENDKMNIINSGIVNTVLPTELCSKMRSSILLMGGMLASAGEVTIPYPGGCSLGSRPIDIHLKAVEKMGVEIAESSKGIYCKVRNLQGAKIKLPFPSVGATENIMLLGTLAKGVTIIENPAKEPEIVDLQLFLNKAGGNICGAGTNRIYIEGVKKLDWCEHTIIPDRIETGTFMTMAVATGGELFIESTEPKHLSATIDIVKKTGAVIKINKNSLYIDAPEKINAIEKIATNVYPKLPTDMQAEIMAMVLKAKGKSYISENIFNGRNKHIPEMNKMGANITQIDSRHFEVNGVDNLVGTEVEATDLRGGAGLIIAGLSAEGETTIKNISHIERGYDKFDEKIQAIGGKIYKV